MIHHPYNHQFHSYIHFFLFFFFSNIFFLIFIFKLFIDDDGFNDAISSKSIYLSSYSLYVDVDVDVVGGREIGVDWIGFVVVVVGVVEVGTDAGDAPIPYY